MLKQAAYWGTLLVLSILVLGSFLRVGIDNYGRARFGDMLAGTAYKPFVYRSPPARLIAVAAGRVPAPVRERLARMAATRSDVAKACDLVGWEKARLSDYLVASVLLLVCLVGFALAIRLLVRSLYDTTVTTRMVLSLVAVAGLPPLFRFCSYLYDPPLLALFTLGLALLALRRWPLYLVVLALATLTKETAVLLVVLFALRYRRALAPRVYYGLLGAQGVVYVVLTALLRYHFRGNPGVSLEFHLGRNLTLAPYGIGTFVGLVVFGLAVAHRWPAKPALLRDGVMLLVPLVLLALVFGYVDEYRDYYEVYPSLFLLAADTACRVLGVARFTARPGDAVGAATPAR